MKLLIKKIVLPAIICLLFTAAFGQAKPDTAVLTKNWVFTGLEWIDTTKATPRQKAIIYKRNKAKILAKDHFYFSYPFKNIGVRFTGGSGKKSEIYEGNNWGNDKRFKSIIIDGNCSVEFSALDITAANAGDFRYHVVQNDKRELVSWTKPSVFKQTIDGEATYAYLGKFDYVPGQVLKVEIYNVNNYAYFDAVLIDWRKAEKPQVEGFLEYFSSQSRLTDNGLFGKGLTDRQQTVERYYKKDSKKPTMALRPVSVKDFIETTDVNDIKFRADDSVKNLGFWLRNGNLTYSNKVTLVKPNGNGTETIQLGVTNDKILLTKDIWKTPGKYTVTFTPKLYRHGGSPVYLQHKLATSISFTVLPPENKDIPLKTVVAIILTLMTATAIMFTLYRNKQKRKLAQEAQNRQIATLQLQSVRSQLNPHFIFNALAGIQNLINKNAIEDANKYLTRFAKLTRNVLDEGQKDLISIEQEINLLDYYLQMEQTRFGFNFNIKVDDEIDQQIEIPAMLLQPFAENAVKHGISALKEKGQVDVTISQSGNDILLKVQDNGKGFNGQQTDGKGIKLCKERIALFNSIHKKTPILLHIKPADNGTLIVIELKNWL
jgi:two-component system LytT family sensor kinase